MMRVSKDIRRYNMGEITREDITPEFIAAFESDLKLLESKEAELTELVDRLKIVDSEIKTLRTKSVQTKPPLPGGVLSLEEKPLWGSFIGELKRYAHDNEELTKLKNELDDLTDERNEIRTKILEIVPESVRNYKPQITAKQFTINVSDTQVTLIR